MSKEIGRDILIIGTVILGFCIVFVWILLTALSYDDIASTAIIGGADSPTLIFIGSRLFAPLCIVAVVALVLMIVGGVMFAKNKNVKIIED